MVTRLTLPEIAFLIVLTVALVVAVSTTGVLVIKGAIILVERIADA